MEEKVINLVADILEMDAEAVNNELNNTELWDSLKRAELVFALEDEFEIFFEQEEIEYMNSVNKIIEVVGRK